MKGAQGKYVEHMAEKRGIRGTNKNPTKRRKCNLWTLGNFFFLYVHVRGEKKFKLIIFILLNMVSND